MVNSWLQRSTEMSLYDDMKFSPALVFAPTIISKQLAGRQVCDCYTGTLHQTTHALHIAAVSEITGCAAHPAARPGPPALKSHYPVLHRTNKTIALRPRCSHRRRSGWTSGGTHGERPRWVRAEWGGVSPSPAD